MRIFLAIPVYLWKFRVFRLLDDALVADDFVSRAENLSFTRHLRIGHAGHQIFKLPAKVVVEHEICPQPIFQGAPRRNREGRLFRDLTGVQFQVGDVVVRPTELLLESGIVF